MSAVTTGIGRDGDSGVPATVGERRGNLWLDAGRRLLRNRVAMASLILLILVAASAVLAPYIAPYPLGQPDLTAMMSPPSWRHLMGTNQIGQDVLTQVLYGGRVSLLIGLTAAIIAVAVGGLVGLVSGYVGGFVDNLLMRITDLALSVPVLFVVMVVLLIVTPTVWSVIAVIGLTSWMYPARIVRSAVLSIKEREFVEASRAAGAHGGRVVFREILPNTMSPLLVNAALLVGQAILTESTVDFLGAGLSPPNVSWGYLLNEAQTYVQPAPWMAIFPGIMIFLVVLGVNILGDGLRSALDPTERR